MSARTFVLEPANARERFKLAWQAACAILQFDKPVKVTVGEYERTRSLDQNAKLWAQLHDIADQVDWLVDGTLQTLTAEEWKDILTAGLTKTQRVAVGIDGGFVILGQHTRRLTTKQFAELLDFIDWFAAERGVTFRDVPA